MALQALATPSVYWPDPTFTSLVVPTGTAYSGSTFGLTFPNVPAGLVALLVLTQTGATTVTVTAFHGSTAINAVSLATLATNYLIGPFDPAVYSDTAGLVHVVFGTGANVNTVLPVILPASAPLVTMRATHCPLETVSGAADW